MTYVKFQRSKSSLKRFSSGAFSSLARESEVASVVRMYESFVVSWETPLPTMRLSRGSFRHPMTLNKGLGTTMLRLPTLCCSPESSTTTGTAPTQRVEGSLLLVSHPSGRRWIWALMVPRTHPESRTLFFCLSTKDSQPRRVSISSHTSYHFLSSCASWGCFKSKPLNRFSNDEQ